MRKLNPKGKAPILCFVGPPGVGKTSLGKSIARALNRNFVRISMGGVRDEAEIRGHRRTYIGSMPGTIINKIIAAGSFNTVFMIDEVDKITHAGTHGDPAAALLELLDPEQNNTFQDHYLNFGIDLSKIFFIPTANKLIKMETPTALIDRMEKIVLPGYTENEKIEIAKRFLIPKQKIENGIYQIENANKIIIAEQTIQNIVREYTSEAGLRHLEQHIAGIFRSIASKALKNEKYPTQIDMDIVKQPDFLGNPPLLIETARPTNPGEVIGLAWTENGGCILFIEAIVVPGDGQISKTGLLGERFQELIKVAASLIRNRYEDKINFNQKLIHINAPDEESKDGPSAGLAIFLALESFLSQRALKPSIAITGSINLQKMVLPVGGIKEKTLAAERAGIKEIILPRRNEISLEEIPKEIKDKLIFHLVETIDEAEKIVFE